MRIKRKYRNKVKMQGVNESLMWGLSVCDQVMQGYDYEVELTSVNDGKHGYGSLHPLGHAADFSLYSGPNAPEVNEMILKECQERLGHEFDLVLEKDHFHLEFQPKAT